MTKKTSSQVRTTSNAKSVVIDFGTRAISDQNFSRIIALPKQALANLGKGVERVNVALVQENDAKFIRLTVANLTQGGDNA